MKNDNTDRSEIETQGVVARGASEPVRLERVLVGEPGPGEILVRILATGLCHSDIHCAQGVFGSDFPYLLGHEAAGIVERIGEGVTTRTPGDYVVLAWHAPCGVCVDCRQGRPQHCLHSRAARSRMRTADGVPLTPASTLGTFSTHTVVAQEQAIAVPEEVPATAACLVGCAVSTGVGAALRTAQVREGSSVAVFGCGGVGVNVIQGARIARAERIVAVDLAEEKLGLARLFGATETVNGAAGDAAVQVRELTDGQGVDYAFEVSGSPAAFQQALASLATHGTCVIVGVPTSGATVSLSVGDLYWKAATIRTSWYGDSVASRDFPQLCDLYLRGELKLDELATQVVTLADAPAEMASIGSSGTLRTVIQL
jgi:S-(hydroxymethyl)mycothiol dehydrogenase